MSRRRPGHILPFRIPFFRIFYSTTYTTIYLICLCFLGATPVSMIWSAIDDSALQYVIIIGGCYLLAALVAIFIYASRLYTNRTVLAGVGKAYVLVEDGEVKKSVRRMIIKQIERSAVIAWESRPRDVMAEAMQIERQGEIPAEATGERHKYRTVGRLIPIDPARPPWGDMQHAGWSSPARRNDNEVPDLQFTMVIAELPNLIEARAVSIAPPDPIATPTEGAPLADPIIIEVLRRPETMGMRDYLTQLSYLGLVNPPEAGQSFLHLYENARFSGLPISEAAFNRLMTAFASILTGMTGLDREIIDAIRAQTSDRDLDEALHEKTSTPSSSIISPVTARTAPSRNITPYMQQEFESAESLGFVVRDTTQGGFGARKARRRRSYSPDTPSLQSAASETGSVVHHRASFDEYG